MKASGAISITSAAMAALDLLGRHHVVERVVERPQIGIDLLLHVAGQEAEPLAGLDRRARQDDALDHAALEQHRRMGDGQIGLAGAGRADAEDQLGALQRAHIGVLVERAGMIVFLRVAIWAAAILPLRSSVGSVSWSSAAIAMRTAPSTSDWPMSAPFCRMP